MSDIPFSHPPASSEAILRLPSAQVYPFDKARLQKQSYDEECSVCMEQLIDGVAVSRMPCGHVFHINCIVAWLGQSCACPECRFEMETSDPQYEVGRKLRMKNHPTYTCDCPTKGIHRCFFPSENLPTLSTFEQTPTKSTQRLARAA
jgi:Ring finger domain